jgi:hypothetical protein
LFAVKFDASSSRQRWSDASDRVADRPNQMVVLATRISGCLTSRPMPGPVLVLLVMFLIGPIGLFVVGAIWSGLFGWMLVDDTEQPAGGAEAQASTS